jgi:hypothetical protein
MSTLKNDTDTSPSILTDEELATYYMATSYYTTLEAKIDGMNLIRRYSTPAQIRLAEELVHQKRMTAARLAEVKDNATTNASKVDPFANEHHSQMLQSMRRIVFRSPLLRTK